MYYYLLLRILDVCTSFVRRNEVWLCILYVLLYHESSKLLS